MKGAILSSSLPMEPPLTAEQQAVKAKLLGDISFLAHLKGVLEDYSFRADPDQGAEDIVKTVARFSGLVVP